MYAYIARQAIYDYEGNVAGYELLYRNGSGNAARITDADAATCALVSDAVHVFGLSRLTGGLPAHINFTRKLLIHDFAWLIRPADIVIEVPGSSRFNDMLINKLGELRKSGYRLALNAYADGLEEFAELFDIIRINLAEGNRVQQQKAASRLWRGGVKLLAGHVETSGDFDYACGLGCALFQGYYFRRPMYFSRQKLPFALSPYGQLINELLQPNPVFERLCSIVSRDLALLYLLLRQTEASAHYREHIDDAVKYALRTMDADCLLRWVCLVFLRQNNATPSGELPRQALARGYFISCLTEHAVTRIPPARGFLLGVFSLLDRVTGLQMQNLLDGLELEPPMKAALLGREENEYTRFLQYAVIYEMANARLILPDIRLSVDRDQVSRLYSGCLTDASTAFAQMEGEEIHAKGEKTKEGKAPQT